jgi:hypothetical protein
MGGIAYHIHLQMEDKGVELVIATIKSFRDWDEF